MTRRARRKKLRRKFRVGDSVTWGLGVVWCPVTRVTDRGVYVRVEPFEDGAPRQDWFLHFAPPSESSPGPPRRE